MNRVVLVITDGIGDKPKTPFNAFANANKPTYDYLFKNVPYSLIKTHGHSVGLPEGQMGNSEVGHMTIGSGRIIYQDLEKISIDIEQKTILLNPEFIKMQNSDKNIHIIGLCSDGGVHSHIEQIKGIAKLLSSGKKKIFLHLVTDGRDVSPISSPKYIKNIEEILDENIKIATISGRFYTMDRDKRWERVELGYKAIVNATPKTTLTPLQYIDSEYKKEITDEFLEPVAFYDYDGIKDGDMVLMANFRSDRARQISQLLAQKEFMPIKVDKKDIALITMTEYAKDFDFPVLFKKETPKNTLAEIVSKKGLSQFHTAETEKYAHVTFFLNGGIEEPFYNETRVLIPSPSVSTYDKKPQMSAFEVTDAVLKAIDEKYDLIIVNFANGDMVGHTGNYEAALKAVEAVDSSLKKIIDSCEKNNYSLVITSDHGNCEEMRDSDGNILTNHTVGDVYCFVKAQGISKVENGGLSNIAPTVLKLMNIEIPKEMDKPLI